MSKQHITWLSFLCPDAPADTLCPLETAKQELKNSPFGKSIRYSLQVQEDWLDAYQISLNGDEYIITGGNTGILYGSYALLTSLCSHNDIPHGKQTPKYNLRMLDCWDNVSGDVERGYSGRSLFYDANIFQYDENRMRTLARMMATCGLNVLCINNVNVHEPAQQLIEDWLPQTAKLAALFRPYGVRLMVSIDFSRPMKHGIPTADPLDTRVQAWWKQRADEIWAAIPDMAGFLVKADSEHRPGPFTYNRTHAEGANMLAKAVAPHNGIIVWRCFVYNCMQDWRDTKTDRACAAGKVYKPLDGQFHPNVLLQIKYGPFDFQVREPISPLLVTMRHTNLALELQLAQEYTGQQIDIFTMAPLWKELFHQMDSNNICAIAAVSNLGRDDNYTGHPLAAVNMFTYGLLAWNPAYDTEHMIRLWCRLTYQFSIDDENQLVQLLMNSRHVYELYTASLGLGWMVTPNQHYGPNPCGYEYQAWGTYHKANHEAVGIDRTGSGTGFTEQYPDNLKKLYSHFDTCPDEYKLFFFRLRYDTVMSDGRTLLQRMYDDRFLGYQLAREMQEQIIGLPFPEPDKAIIVERMEKQVKNAQDWCDIVNTFFYRLTGIPDAHGRLIYD